MLTVKYSRSLKRANNARRRTETFREDVCCFTRLKSVTDLDHLAMDSYTGTSFHFMVSILFI